VSELLIPELLDATRMTRVVACPRPFSTYRVDLEVPPGQTIAQILAGLQIPPWAHARVFLDDWLVDPEWYPRVRPRPGTTVTVRVVPTFGGDDRGGKNILGIVLMIAVIVVSIWVPGALGLTGFWASALQAGISIVGSLLISALIPPQAPKLGDLGGSIASNRVSPTLSITGTSNKLNPYGPIPRPLGKHRIFPPYGAMPFTEIVGDNQYLRLLFCLGYGPLTITDLKIGDSPLGQFQGVQVETRQGYVTDPPLTLYTRDIEEDGLSIHMSQGVPLTRRTRPDTDQISVDFTMPNGLAVIIQSNGIVFWHQVTIRIRYRLVGTTPWITRGTFTFPKKSLSPVRFNRTWGVAKGQYDVEVTRLDEEKQGQSIFGLTYFDKTFWSALRSIHAQHPINKKGLALVAMRIKATDQLNSVIDRFNCVVQSILPSWDGAAWTAAPTSNPAAMYREVLQGSANARPVADARLDLPGLQAWSTACDAAGRQFNAVVDFGTTVFELLRDVAATGRASFHMQDGKFSVIRDVKQSTPIQHFTQRNSWGFRGTKVWPPEVHALKARFINRVTGWQQDERIVYDDGFTAKNASKFEALELFGVTDRDQAWKDARYHLAVARLRPELYELNVDVENLVCSRGDLVRVVHDVPLFGIAAARIKSITLNAAGNITALALDENVSMAAGKRYAVRIRQADGTSFVQEVTGLAISADDPAVAVEETGSHALADYPTGVYPGAYVGGVTPRVAGLLEGDSDRGAEFNGVDGVITTGARLDFAAAGGTIEAWVAMSSLAVTGCILGGANGNFTFRVIGTNKTFDLALGGFTDGQNAIRSAPIAGLAAGVAVYLAATWHPVNGFKAYVNGVDVKDIATNLASFSTTALQIGKRNSGTAEWFPGTIDEVAVYNAELSAAAIAAHYAARLAGADYRATVLADSPVAYWRLGEGVGTAALTATAPIIVTRPVAKDESVNGLDGTYTSGGLLGVGSLVSGESDGAAGFDGTDDHVVVPDNDAIDVGIGDFSIEAWFRLDAVGATRRIVAKGPTATIGYILQVDASGRLVLVLADGAQTSYVLPSGNFVVVAGTVYYAVVSVVRASPTGINWYVNGVNVKTDDPTARQGSLSNATALSIGGASNFFIGTLDEVALYGVALSPAQVAAHYAAREGGGYRAAVMADSPVGYWRFSEAMTPSSGDLLLFGELGIESAELLVKSIEPGRDLTAKLTLVDKAPAVYDADAGPVPALADDPSALVLSNVTLQAIPLPPTIDSIVSDDAVLVVGPDGRSTNRILITLVPIGLTAAPSASPASVEARYRLVGAPTTLPGGEVGASAPVDPDDVLDDGAIVLVNDPGPFLAVPAQPVALGGGSVSIQPVDAGATYDVQVRFIAAGGGASEWVTVRHTVVGKTIPPADVPIAALEGTTLRWAYPNPPADFAGYRVRVQYGDRRSWADAQPLHHGLLAEKSLALALSGQATLLVKAVDAAGNESATPAAVVADFGAPVIGSLVEVVDKQSAGFPGTVTGAVSGSSLLAAATGLKWSESPDRLLWSTDVSLDFWTGGIYRALEYLMSYVPDRARAGNAVVLDLRMTPGPYAVEYRIGGSGLFWAARHPESPVESDAARFWTAAPGADPIRRRLIGPFNQKDGFYNVGTDLPFWSFLPQPDDAWLPWPGRLKIAAADYYAAPRLFWSGIPVTALFWGFNGGENDAGYFWSDPVPVYEFRIRAGGGRAQGRLDRCAVMVDAT
jgi:hypothetical protein